MKKNKFLKYLLYVTGALILFLIIGKKAGWVGQKEMINVTAEKPQKRNIVETVSANGKVQPEVEVKISPDVPGEVVELTIKEGDEVKKGQLLAKINPIIYASAVDRMVAALNTAKANLANAKARLAQSESQYSKAEAAYKRNKKLADEGTISASDFEAAKSAWEVAKADVDASKENVTASDFSVRSSEASLKEARDNLNKTIILAPVNGTVSKLSIEKGERVVGTSQMAGTEMMRIANLKEMEVTVDVNENDIVRVHLNDTANIEVDSYLDRKFKGVVTEIGNSANTTGLNTDQVTNFPVKIRILRESYEDLIPKNNPNQSPFRPGMSATVEILTRRASQVISIPVQSVTTRDTAKLEPGKKGKKEETKQDATKKVDKKAEEFVILVKDGKAVFRKVETGIQDNNFIEIRKGLDGSEEVITGPYSAISKKIKSGDLIKVVPKDKLFEKDEKQ